jgi:RNA polymerase sigma-70 factor (ECF subfamily)
MNELTAIRKGSEPAFVHVYYQYHKKLFRFFLKRMSNHETARELTQETFIKLWKSRHTLSAEHSTETQLFTIAGSVLIDHLRRQAHEKRRLSAMASTLHSEAAVAHASPYRSLETADYLRAVVRDLPPARKRIMLLKMGSGYSNKEIAEQLSISEKTVEDHVTKALRHIRSVLTLLSLLFVIIPLVHIFFLY